MEEIIKKCFCNNCINENKNCMQIKVEKRQNLLSYKCVNYAKKQNFIYEQNIRYIIKSDIF